MLTLDQLEPSAQVYVAAGVEAHAASEAQATKLPDDGAHDVCASSLP